jgi:hypothetical protein
MFQENVYNTIKAELKNITNITYLTLTSRCNESIKIALEVTKKKGKTKCLILEEGGWITYTQFAKELGFEIIELKTKDCAIDFEALEDSLDKESVLILHSLSGYFYKQPMQKIHLLCQAKNAMLINDCSGSVSCFDLLYGDLFVCSFGKWKPLNHGIGGFIGTRDSPLFYKYVDRKDVEFKDPQEMLTVISRLQERVTKINERSQSIIRELKQLGFSPLQQNTDLTLVVIVPFEDKTPVIEYCLKVGLEFVECPRNIRICGSAISIEVKRLSF